MKETGSVTSQKTRMYYNTGESCFTKELKFKMIERDKTLVNMKDHPTSEIFKKKFKVLRKEVKMVIKWNKNGRDV